MPSMASFMPVRQQETKGTSKVARKVPRDNTEMADRIGLLDPPKKLIYGLTHFVAKPRNGILERNLWIPIVSLEE